MLDRITIIIHLLEFVRFLNTRKPFELSLEMSNLLELPICIRIELSVVRTRQNVSYFCLFEVRVDTLGYGYVQFTHDYHQVSMSFFFKFSIRIYVKLCINNTRIQLNKPKLLSCEELDIRIIKNKLFLAAVLTRFRCRRSSW